MGVVLTTCSSWIGCGSIPEKDEALDKIERNRACTDVLCCGLFLAFFAAMMGMWIWAADKGDIDRLLGGYDYNGKACMSNEEYTMYPFMDSATYTIFTDVGICTKSCNDTNALTPDPLNLFILPYATSPYESQDVGNRCLPLDENHVNEMATLVGDLKDAMPIVGASAAIAFFLVALFCILTRYFAALIVYGTIGAVLISGAAAGLFCYTSSVDADTGETTDELMQYVSFGIWVFTAIVLLLVVFFRKNIKIAIEVLKSASRALSDMSWMFLFPIGPFVIGLVFFLCWCSATALLFSMGDMGEVDMPEPLQGVTVYVGPVAIAEMPEKYAKLTYDENLQNMLWANLFFMFWVMNFLMFFTYTTLSGAVADWYFTRRDENGKKPRGGEEGQLTKWPVLSAFWRTLRYHCGTIAFGALIIALIQLARAMIAYAQKQLKDSNNKMAQYLLAALQCCLWCFEKCMKFIGKNALIFTAIYGKPFCPSACASFMLVWSNLARVGIMKVISGCITLLGKACTVAGTCMISYILLTKTEPFKDTVESLFFPGLIIFLLSWLVAVIFMMVYDTAIDTVFMCYLVDIEHNQQGNMLADEGLRRVVQKYEVQSRAYADKNKGAAEVEPED